MTHLFLVAALGLGLPQLRSDSGRFTIYQDGRPVGTEEFSISPGKGGYIAEGRTRITVGGESYDLKSHLEMDDQFRPTFYEYQRQGSSLRFRIRKDVSEFEYTVDGKTSPVDVRFPEGGAIIDNNFFHHYIFLLQRMQQSQVTFPVVVPQSMTLGQITVRVLGGGKFEIETDALKIHAETDAGGRLRRMTDPGGKVIVER